MQGVNGDKNIIGQGKIIGDNNLIAGVDEAVPAGGAGGVGGEPPVDAAHVEAVVAAGQNPNFVANGELGEADGAVGVVEVEVISCCVVYDRERLERLLFNPGVGESSRRGGGAAEGAPDD